MQNGNQLDYIKLIHLYLFKRYISNALNGENSEQRLKNIHCKRMAPTCVSFNILFKVDMHNKIRDTMI